MSAMEGSSRFLFGLYLYCRHLDRSVDRALLSPWSDVVEYFADRMPVGLVLKCLKDNVRLLPEGEMANICGVLDRFRQYLGVPERPPQDALIRLRMDLRLAEDLLITRLGRDPEESKPVVEHFLHNEWQHPPSIEQILGGPWPDQAD